MWRPSSDNSGMWHTALLTCLMFWVSSSMFDNIPSFRSVKFAVRNTGNFGTITSNFVYGWSVNFWQIFSVFMKRNYGNAGEISFRHKYCTAISLEINHIPHFAVVIDNKLNFCCSVKQMERAEKGPVWTIHTCSLTVYWFSRNTFWRRGMRYAVNTENSSDLEAASTDRHIKSLVIVCLHIRGLEL